SRVLLGVEPLNERSLAAVLGDTIVLNGYGPTEATVYASAYAGPLQPLDRNIPIGRPIANTQIYLLDEDLNPVPVGVAGEIHIAGAGLARGYLNRPALTAEKFIANPYGEPGSRMYRTGDLGRYLPDGNIEFLGRIDHQVKIRGFRIELGEIENALLAHAQVREVVVLAREDDPGNKRLVAYVVGKAAAQAPSLTVSELRSHLGRTLPEYMVPTGWVFLDALPLNPNGKIDRKALPAPETTREDLGTEYVAPRTPTEELLAQIWAEVLKVERVGVFDRFRQLGGTSIQGIAASLRVSKELGLQYPPLLVGNSTIREYSILVDAAVAVQSGRGRHADADDREEEPASFAQEQVHFLEQLGDAWRAYRFHGKLKLRGLLQFNKLERALNNLLERHDLLRTAFVSNEGKLLRVVKSHVRQSLLLTDLSELSEDGRARGLQSLQSVELDWRFDVASPPLIRWHLVRLAPEEHVLFQTEHHFVHDGQSWRLMLRDIGAFYSAAVQGKEHELPLIEAEYGEFCRRERLWSKSDEYAGQLSRCSERIKRALTNQKLFYGIGRQPKEDRRFAGSQVRQLVDAALLSTIDRCASDLGATRFAVALAAFAILCSRHTGSKDILIGTALSNRLSHRYQATVGMFVNAVAIPIELSNPVSFSQLVGAAGAEVDFALQQGQVCLAEIIRHLDMSNRFRGEPPFGVAFSFHDSIPLNPNFAGLEVAVEEGLPNGSAKFDLNVVGILGNRNAPAPLEFAWEYNTDLFDRSTIERMAGHFKVLLEAVVADPQARLKDLPLLTEAERHRILVEWNDTEKAYPSDRCIHQLFEEQVAKSPEAVAVVFEDQQLSYGELNAKANQLAHHLRGLGVKPDTLVAICVERSLEMVIGLLGILKAGGAYVPLDPDYPAERLAYMLQDTAAPVLLTQGRLKERLPAHQARTVCLDEDWAAIGKSESTNPVSHTHPLNLAYCIYTSGSTGKPKGVLIEHRQVARLLSATDAWYGFNSSDVWTVFHSFAFDFSVWELWGALTFGGRALVVSYEASRTAERFVELLESEGVTVLNQTPTAFRALVNQIGRRLPRLDLRYVIFGGEALSVGTLGPWFEQFGDVKPKLVNMYGITETTVHVTYRPVGLQDVSLGSCPIGKPIPDLSAYILGPAAELLPIGAAGEIYIAGAGLARGYLNRADLTAEKFIANPYGDPGSRMYRTGDLGRYLSDGNIEFLGR
ncbi:MAG: amino acid adenylation domain-containing protein, partial [bacterium]